MISSRQSSTNMLGLERRLGYRIGTYADDLIILCRTGKAEKALRRLRELMGKLKLTVNEEKTRIYKVPKSEFTFLGYSFGLMHSTKTVCVRVQSPHSAPPETVQMRV